ncbi:MAG: tyrosine-type recombinase/integrase [Gammaproteobacteria bacterium]
MFKPNGGMNMGTRRGFQKLTDAEIRKSKPREKPYKLFDGRGLYLEVCPSGSRLWRIKYRIGGKEKRAALGAYPEVSLAAAREKAIEARRHITDGNDPITVKRIARLNEVRKQTHTFKAVAEEWISKRAWGKTYREKVAWLLSGNLYRRIGDIPLSELDAPTVIAAVRPIEMRGALEQAYRALRFSAAIFRFGMIHGYVDKNPLEGIKPSEVLQGRTTKSFPHLRRDEIGDFLRALQDYPGRSETRIAVKLLLLTFVRTKELRSTKWTEIDLEHCEWRIPAERMKRRQEHVVPLARQAIELLKELQGYSGYSEYLFPNHGKHPYMSENTINKAISVLGYKGRIVGHGFRATASTVLNESGLFTADAIERQLAHKEPNEVRAIYNRAAHLPERRKMMQWWADFLDAAQRGGEVVLLRR